MKHGKRHLSLILPVMLAALSACNNPLTPPLTPPKTQDTAPDGAPAGGSPTGMGALTVNLEAEGEARTAGPVLSFAQYVLSFSGGPDSVAPVTIAPAASHTVYLLPGTWTVGVSAYTDAACTILAAQGSASVTVAANTAAAVTVPLGFASSGTGTITYTISFPADTYSVKELTVTRGLTGFLDTAFTSGTQSGPHTLDAGAYTLALTLTNTTQGHTAYWQTAVHIFGGHTTNVSHTFTAADFATSVPVTGTITLTQNAVPASLAVRAYPNSTDTTTPIATALLTEVNSTGTQTYTYTLFIPASQTTPYLRLEADSGNSSTPEAVSPFPGTAGAITTSFSRTFHSINTAAGSVTGSGTVTAKTGGTGGTPVSGAFEGAAITLIAAPNTNNGLNSSGMSISSGTLGGTGSDLTRTFTMPAADVTVTAAFLPLYTITFEHEGGTGGDTSAIAAYGQALPAATAPTRTGYTFGGYYTAANGGGTQWYNNAMTVTKSPNTYTATEDTTLYAKWTTNTAISISSAAGWTNALTTIQNGGNDQSYTLTISGTISVPSSSDTFGSVTGLNVTLAGTGNLTLSSAGHLIGVGSNQTVTINGPTLTGCSNGEPVLSVGAGSNVVLQNGIITGNSSSNGGGGVYVHANGTFTMSGGTISNNTAGNGGGVYVYNNGTFIMSGGTISGNTAIAPYHGGGVYVNHSSGTFTKTGGTIYGDTDTTHTTGNTENTATGGATKGHAVYVVSGGTKYRNTTAEPTDNVDTAANSDADGSGFWQH
ncbi:beta strand repeat-containing protein [Breznakiellaceae bacterium SP9]